MKQIYILFTLLYFFHLTAMSQESSRPFITTWETTSTSRTITIPTTGGGYDYSVDWGDGTAESGFSGDATHTYAEAGTYTVSISGDFPRIFFNNTRLDINLSRTLIRSIDQWGDQQWNSFASAFAGCSNLVYNATDTPDLSNVEDMSSAFEGASRFNGNIDDWDVSKVTDMSSMFKDASSFNQPLNNWNVGNVTDMSRMFADAVVFNQPLNDWDVSSVTNMETILGTLSNFTRTMAFNQDISNWNVTNVTDMSGMFRGARSFNSDIGNWDVSNVTNMSGMFGQAFSFNADISSWDVSNVTNMSGMFREAISFNSDIGNWDVSNVTNMGGMFLGRLLGSPNMIFNHDLNKWDVGNVTNMAGMFQNNPTYNRNLSDWDVSNVTNMRSMFDFASRFNGDISTWNVSNVTNMNRMFFLARRFNNDVSSWDVSKVTDMTNMFGSATDFNQNLEHWNIVNAASSSNLSGFLIGTRISTTNYDATLIGWSQLSDLPKGRTLGASARYCDDSGRAKLIEEFNWTINDAGKGTNCPPSITFEPLADVTFGDERFELVASTTSELPITYTSSDETVATIDGNIVSILAAGTTTITATQS
ncbi:MAG: BspA family leucine-rich repeat surface protein, partial [Cyclobacteriaceae bacterium]|nr:BspA family leucine-rich repeat surface protein [Cyclobacteriaceae bacterium]